MARRRQPNAQPGFRPRLRKIMAAGQASELLRREGLVQARREGQAMWYSIASRPGQRVMMTLFELFCAPAPLCGDAAPNRGD